MYNPGRNKTPIYIYSHEEWEEAPNEMGELVQKPKLITKEWVELKPMTGKQFEEQRHDESAMTFRFLMRSRKDINVGDTVEFDGRFAEIIYISNPPGRYMEMVVEWRTS